VIGITAVFLTAHMTSLVAGVFDPALALDPAEQRQT
jgi:hypothetical protein